MTPLLEALRDAARVGFDAPKCASCPLRGPAAVGPCSVCEGTGLDASDPERLIGHAEQWLLSKYQHPRLESYPTTTHFSIHGSAYGVVVRLEHESHNRTPEGRATALLRLVARVGEAK